jgi:hypothetical protein
MKSCKGKLSKKRASQYKKRQLTFSLTFLRGNLTTTSLSARISILIFFIQLTGRQASSGSRPATTRSQGRVSVGSVGAITMSTSVSIRTTWVDGNACRRHLRAWDCGKRSFHPSLSSLRQNRSNSTCWHPNRCSKLLFVRTLMDIRAGAIGS